MGTQGNLYYASAFLIQQPHGHRRKAETIGIYPPTMHQYGTMSHMSAHKEFGTTAHDDATDSSGASWVPHTLRLSVTDRCSLKCTYCMPASPKFIPHDNILRFEEYLMVVDAMRNKGLDTVRITGGEPLIRRGIEEFVAMLAKRNWLKRIGMTTNGLHLLDLSDRLWNAGLRHLNISLDSMDTARFEKLTRRRGLQTILVGIKRSVRRGFQVKLNAVLRRSVNLQDFLPLLDFAGELAIPIRFIEYMPFGDQWTAHDLVTTSELEERAATVGVLRPLAEENRHTRRYELVRSGGSQEIGFVPAVTAPFCERCDRLRLTADGILLNCMFDQQGINLSTQLKAGDGVAVEKALDRIVQRKTKYLLGWTPASRPGFGLNQVGG